MKKNILIIISIIVLFFSNSIIVNGLSKSNMETLKLKSVKKFNNPKGFSSVQGGTVTDKYIVSLFRNSTDTKTAVMVLNKKSYKKTSLGGTNYKLGHGNGATYNSKTNEILTIDKKVVHILNAKSFKEKKKITLDNSYHAIGYDSLTNQYVLASKSNNKITFHIMDSNFKEKSNFSINVNMTSQSLTVKNGIIYYCTYESGKKTKYQSSYDKVLKAKENAIYVYDINGNKKTIYYIPKSYNGEVFNEIENVSFDGNKMIVQFNKSGSVGYYTPVSKLKSYTITDNKSNTTNKSVAKTKKDESVTDTNNITDDNNVKNNNLESKKNNGIENKTKENDTNSSSDANYLLVKDETNEVKEEKSFSIATNSTSYNNSSSEESTTIETDNNLLTVAVPNTESNSSMFYIGVCIVLSGFLYIKIKKNSNC